MQHPPPGRATGGKQVLYQGKSFAPGGDSPLPVFASWGFSHAIEMDCKLNCTSRRYLRSETSSSQGELATTGDRLRTQAENQDPSSHDTSITSRSHRRVSTGWSTALARGAHAKVRNRLRELKLLKDDQRGSIAHPIKILLEAAK